MEQKDIVEFFDACAPSWDDRMVRNEDVLTEILNNAEIREGIDVLDVACGTGVLFPDYLKRNVASLTGIDISPRMVEIASQKFPQVKVICDDAQTHRFDKQFDAIVVYNAFPHFTNPMLLIKSLAEATKCGGRLMIAHGMSREALKIHHEKVPHVSAELPTATELAKMLELYFDVDVVVSNDKTYQVVGRKKN